MAAQKRVDNKRRILKDGESQLPDGRYRYRYFDMDGCRQVVYSWKLVERDRMPPGKKDDLSLREKERQIERDMEDSIKTGRDAKITLNQMFETYMTGKISLKQSTRTNYIYMYTHYVQDGFGKKMLKDIRYSDVKAFYNSLIVEKGFKANSMEIINTLGSQIAGWKALLAGKAGTLPPLPFLKTGAEVLLGLLVLFFIAYRFRTHQLRRERKLRYRIGSHFIRYILNRGN